MAKAVNETLAVNQLVDAYIRLVVTRGLVHWARSESDEPSAGHHHRRLLTTLYPKEFYEKGLEIITASTIRNHPAALNPRIKSLNYLNNIMAKIEGLQAGCIEALMLNQKGEVAECTGDNIFIIKRGRCTPHRSTLAF